MTPAKQAKSAGFKSLAEVSRKLGTKDDGQPVVSVTTLGNWHEHKPLLFAAVLRGLRGGE